MKYNFSEITYHVLGYWNWFAQINDSTPLLNFTQPGALSTHLLIIFIISIRVCTIYDLLYWKIKNIKIIVFLFTGFIHNSIWPRVNGFIISNKYPYTFTQLNAHTYTERFFKTLVFTLYVVTDWNLFFWIIHCTNYKDLLGAAQKHIFIMVRVLGGGRGRGGRRSIDHCIFFNASLKVFEL